jgi:tRNA (guanine-N7-)-methyltransferase
MAASPGSGSTSPTSCAAPSDGKVEREAPRRLLYGRRRGRALRTGQERRKAELLPRLSITLPASGPFDLRSLFERQPQSVWLEIGFGGGEHLAAQAEAHPAIGFIGSEVFENGIVRLLGEIERRGLDNVRIFADDARLLLAALPPASLGRVFILFPDPWPKARHHKRRLVSRETLDRLADLLEDGGELRLATDDAGYLSWMLERAIIHPAFEWLARSAVDWRRRPPDWPATRYEQKALAAGRRPAFLRFRRRARG